MPSEPHRIDVHHHIVPREYVEALADIGIETPGRFPFPDWSPEATLELMDQNGIATAMTSISAPGVYFGDDVFARDLARRCNEISAGLVSDHPKRFGAFAVLPLPDVDAALLADGHVQEEEGGKIHETGHYAYNRRHGPSSCLYSNVVDMSRWAIANMNRGELEGSRILDASSYELLWTPTVEVGVRDNKRVYVGLSWFLSEHAGSQKVYHGGRDIGYQTDLVMLPDAGVAVIVLSNYWGPDPIVLEVSRLALELAMGSE